MKVSIIFAEGVKQINLTPENEDEEFALNLIKIDDDISVAAKFSNFANMNVVPINMRLNAGRGDALRPFTDTKSLMLILTPKHKQ